MKIQCFFSISVVKFYIVLPRLGLEISFFFLIVTWLLNSSKWWPIEKKLVAIFKDKQNLFFYAINVLDGPSKIKLG